jgi:integrase
MQTERIPKGSLFIVEMKDGTPVWEAKWRYEGRQVKRRIGKAWVRRMLGTRLQDDLDLDTPWLKRPGRPKPGWFDERDAAVEMKTMIRTFIEAEINAAEIEQARREAEALEGVTLQQAGERWLHWAEHVKGMRPSTISDYRHGLNGVILPRFGKDTSVAEITSAQIAAWRDDMLTSKKSPRTVNKLRQLLSNIFAYATRPDTFALPVNPVLAVEKVKERKPGRLNFFTPEEIEALIRAAQSGAHRKDRMPASGRHARIEEIAARRLEDTQDAALFTVAGYAGLRKGELLALRWRDVDFTARKIHVWLSYTASEEGATKSEESRSVPMTDQVGRTLDALSKRKHFTGPDDLVFCSRTGSFLDGSALRRRYIASRNAADLRPIRFHDLRHSFASLASGEFAPHEVQAFLGHADARTTNRYVHYRPDKGHADRLTAVFAGKAADPVDFVSAPN